MKPIAKHLIVAACFLLCALTAFASNAHAQGGVPLWTNRYNGPGNGSDYANAIAVDRNGNVFVTGPSDGAAFNYDYATIKYSSAGVPLWTNRYTAGESFAVAVDRSGNVFVTGFSSDGVQSDYATLAYSGAGVPLWTNRYGAQGGGGDDSAYAVAVDESGNVYVTGFSTGSSSDSDFVTIKYSSSVLLPVQLAIEPDGNGGYFIRFNGIEGAGYRLRRAADLTGPWPDLATNTAPAPGFVEFHDTNPPPGGAFYRAAQP